MGELTTNVTLPLGTARGQLPQVAGTPNKLAWAAAPTNGTVWSLTGAATLTETGPSLLYGTLLEILTATNGPADEINQTVVPASGSIDTLTVSAIFRVWTIAAQASRNVRMGVRYTGGVAVTHFVDFDPASGHIFATSFGALVNVEQFTDPNSGKIYYEVGLGCPQDLVNTTFQFFIMASPVSGAGKVFFFAPQVADSDGGQNAVPGMYDNTTFASSVNTYSPPFNNGALARSTISQGKTFVPLTSAYTPGPYDINKTFQCTGSITLTLPNIIPQGAFYPNGYNLIVLNADAGTTTVTAGAAGKIFTPGGTLAPALGNSTTVIGVGASIEICAEFDYTNNQTKWRVIDATSAGGVLPTVGSAGTILRSNGTAWAASQDTWPDLVASGNVLFATAANTIGSNNSFTFTSSLFNVPAIATVYSGTIQGASTVGVGGATPSTTGAGITFPATQSLSTDANTIDDYEEGTWTPTDGSGASLSFSTVTGTYTKIGRQVTHGFGLTYPATASGANAQIAGLPFTTNATQSSGFGSIGFSDSGTPPTGLRINVGGTSVSPSLTPNTTSTNVQLSGAIVRAGFTTFTA